MCWVLTNWICAIDEMAQWWTKSLLISLLWHLHSAAVLSLSRMDLTFWQYHCYCHNTPADLEYRAFISHDFNVFKFRQNGNITRLTIWLFVYFFLNAWYSDTLNSFEQYIFPLSSAAGHRSYYHRNKNEVDMLLFIVVITNIKI